MGICRWQRRRCIEISLGAAMRTGNRAARRIAWKFNVSVANAARALEECVAHRMVDSPRIDAFWKQQFEEEGESLNREPVESASRNCFAGSTIQRFGGFTDSVMRVRGDFGLGFVSIGADLAGEIMVERPASSSEASEQNQQEQNKR